MTALTRVSVVRILAVLAIVLIAGGNAGAQSYPTKQVRMVVPFGAGGPADVFARVLAQHLGETFKQNFVVENRPGAGAIIGTNEVAKAAPDGYTLLVMSNTHTTNESLIPNRPYNLMRDFVPVSPINESDVMMVVNPSLGVKNLKEFIALAKSKPGQLNYASSGPGTPYHMAAELFKAMSGTDIVHIPHKASGEMRTAVIGGHVQMAFDAVTTMTENVKAGQVRALATSAAKRSTVLPDVPTVAEAGVPGYEATSWIGMLAPAATPPAIIAQLWDAVNAAMKQPSVRDTLISGGTDIVVSKPQEFREVIASDLAKYAKLADVFKAAK